MSILQVLPTQTSSIMFTFWQFWEMICHYKLTLHPELLFPQDHFVQLLKKKQTEQNKNTNLRRKNTGTKF